MTARHTRRALLFAALALPAAGPAALAQAVSATDAPAEMAVRSGAATSSPFVASHARAAPTAAGTPVRMRLTR